MTTPKTPAAKPKPKTTPAAKAAPAAPAAVAPAAPAPVAAPVAGPVVAKTAWSTTAIAALVVAALETIALLIVRTIAASVAFDSSDSVNTLAVIFGVFGILSLLITIGVIVLGHLAVGQTKGDVKRGRVLAGAALGVGYFHLLLWGNRLILAGIAAAGASDFSQFVPNIFYWA